ncbi:DNA polymerase III subunit alpha [uncultured Paenibacillus sp.]|uniref:DNA polymerase III subunit alpha n=2 Tax=Bacteria TaxID=2 RepID=UPI0028D7BE26|nr:DNA polymerase III subunit alpha [uncultured Paenibacillus sp.]
MQRKERMTMIREDEFVHLHVHSEYSLLDGAARIRDLTAKAAELGMKALALTDHGVMYGAVPFYSACMAAGIKPIIGCEMYLTTGSRFDKGARKESPIYHLILLAKNTAGYRNLMRLCSIGHLEGFHYKPRIDLETLAAHADGLVCLSSCLKGEVSQHLLHDRYEEARASALRYKTMFGGDFYLELQDHGMLDQKKVLAGMLRLADETGIPLAATNDVHYLQPEDAAVQDVLICIGTGKTVEDEARMRIMTDQLYLKSAQEMAEMFRHVPEALANTVRIAGKCELKLEFGRAPLPVFGPLPEGAESASYLRSLCREGLAARYGDTPEWESDAAFRSEAERRLDYELSVIESMGFSDYFLIVWDFIRFAHERGIRTGPGRGSSAGSLVAYTLRITDVDPLKYKLLFERFLNPERITMPDIDIDFNDERRDEVIAYVSAKYGEEHVAQIITFGTMAARAAVRDVGRALAVPYAEVDRAAKLIPNQLGMTLEAALNVSPELREACERSPKTGELIRTALKVEGMPRHASTHAAGVVISKEPLTHHVPLQSGGDSAPLTQYSMEYLEAVGLLKMDFLGLRTLSILERTLRWVKELYGRDIDFRTVPDDDPATYAMLGRGETTGIFQLESAGMRRVLRDMKPSSFEDIVSVLALYRPGPMEFIPKYIAAKHGLETVSYPHPALEPILTDTYGIIVYQEQIMQIASVMAGFSLGEADLLRRAVSKKKREVLDEERAHFVGGSLKQGYAEEDANRVYDMIVRFADYGFPRAHAAAYGVLAFQTAWLKAHYPIPFLASMLASVTGNQRKTAEYVDECRRMGIAVLPPDVNESGVSFTPVEGAVRFGLAAVKNVGTQAIEALKTARAERKFDSLLDLCRRVDLRVANKRVIESLIQAGACDSLEGHRAQILAVLDETIEAAAKWRKEREELQIELFGFDEVRNWDVELPDVRPFTQGQKLEFERELLGLYLSGHPLDEREEELGALGVDRLYGLAEAPDESNAVTAAMIVSVKPFTNRKGQAMGFLELEDRIVRVEAVVFQSVWKRAQELLAKGNLILVQVVVQQQDEDFKLIVEDVVPLDRTDLAGQVRRLQRQARGRSARSRMQDGPAVSAGRAPDRERVEPPSGQAAVRPDAGQPARAAGKLAERPSTEGGPRKQDAGKRGASAGRPAAGGTGGGASGPAATAAGAGADAGAGPGATTGAGAGAPAGAPAAAVAGGAKHNAGAPPQRNPSGRPQRLFIKIAADREQPALLAKLKQLLSAHAGPLDTVLFYEREQKTIALSDKGRVKPSPALIGDIEKLLGKGSAVVK